MSKKISREEFEKLVKSYSTNICSEIIKNGFEHVESWVRIAMSQTLDTKINQNKEESYRNWDNDEIINKEDDSV